MGATVTISRPGRRPIEHELGPATYLIGRDPELRLCLNDIKASRQHAALVIEAGHGWIRDLGSRNGVLVNQARLPARLPQRLEHGDRIQIGLSELRYDTHGQARPTPKRPSRVSGRGQRLLASSERLTAKVPAHPRSATPWWPALAVAASALAGLLLGLLG